MKKTIKTVRDIKAIKPPTVKGRRDTYHDAVEPGLELRVTSNGVYSFTYRRKVKGTCERIAVGHWPTTTIEQARDKAAANRIAFNKNKNPAEDRRLEKQIASNSVELIGDKWLEDYVDINTKPSSGYRRIMKKDVMPPWKDKLITEVSKSDIKSLIDSIVDRGSKVAANRVFAIIRNWMNWCVEKDYLLVSPAGKMKAPTKEKSRERMPTDSELVEALVIADSAKYPHGPYFRLRAMLGQRRTETAKMCWRDLDLNEGLWTIPGKDTKSGRTHAVPLPTQAVALLKTLPRFTKGDFVFTTTQGAKAINGFSKAKVKLDGLIVEQRRKVGNEQGIDDWYGHDLRRAIRTFFGRTRVTETVGEGILSHSLGGGRSKLARTYDLHDYLPEKRAALQSWADHLDALMRTAAAERSA